MDEVEVKVEGEVAAPEMEAPMVEGETVEETTPATEEEAVA